jgi:exonuclease V gamma subunit
VLCVSGQYGDQDSSLLITKESNLRFVSLNFQEARDQLRNYIEFYYQGLAYPLPVFPDASYAWSREDDPARALKNARKAWYSDDYRNIPGDQDNAYVKLATRGCMEEPFTSPDFEVCAERLYAAALKSLVEA